MARYRQPAFPDHRRPAPGPAGEGGDSAVMPEMPGGADGGVWFQITGGSGPLYSGQELQGGVTAVFTDPAAAWDGVSQITTFLPVTGVGYGQLASLNNGAYFASVVSATTGSITLTTYGLGGTRPAAGAVSVAIDQQYLIPKPGGVVADSTGATGYPLAEVNNNIYVPAGAVVRAYFQGAGPYWSFSFSAADSPLTAGSIQSITLPGATQPIALNPAADILEVTVAATGQTLQPPTGGVADRPLVVRVAPGSSPTFNLTLSATAFATPINGQNVTLWEGYSATLRYDGSAWEVLQPPPCTAVASLTTDVSAAASGSPGSGAANIQALSGGSLTGAALPVTAYNPFPTVFKAGQTVVVAQNAPDGDWFVCGSGSGNITTVNVSNITTLTSSYYDQLVFNQFNNNLYYNVGGVWYLWYTSINFPLTVQNLDGTDVVANCVEIEAGNDLGDNYLNGRIQVTKPSAGVARIDWQGGRGYKAGVGYTAPAPDVQLLGATGATTAGVGDATPTYGAGQNVVIFTIPGVAFVASGASHKQGMVPDPGAVAGTTKFLREDATWQVPAGGGFTPTSNQVVQGVSFNPTTGASQVTGMDLNLVNIGTFQITATVKWQASGTTVFGIIQAQLYDLHAGANLGSVNWDSFDTGSNNIKGTIPLTYRFTTTVINQHVQIWASYSSTGFPTVTITDCVLDFVQVA